MNPYGNFPGLATAQAPVAPSFAPSGLSVALPPEVNADTVGELPQAVFGADGTFLGDGSEQELAPTVSEHTQNLAEKLSDEDLKKIGKDLVDAVQSDLDSRKDHQEKFVKGLTALGINFDPEAPQSDVFGSINHPLLIEAATQFQARAMAELYPASGPVKTEILGDSTPQLVIQAGRVQDYMNYQLMIQDKVYFQERDQMLFMLPFTGSEFDKQFYDKNSKTVVSRWVRYQNFVVHYGQTSLEKCPRYAEIMHLELNDIKRFQRVKQYRTVELTELSVDEKENAVNEKIKDIDGVDIVSPSDDNSMRDVYEVHIDYDLPGFENEDGILLPYIITVDKESEQVLAIYRNWDEKDDSFQKRVWYTHKKFLPGFGFYGFGLFHTIGSLGEVATKILQILLDAGAFSSLQGGFKSKDAKIPSDTEIEPGVYKDIDLTAEELQKAFFTPQFKEPSATLFNLLGAIVELGRRFAATTEVMVGDAATTGPVGTTVALVEQGSKVFSGIHKRLHNALSAELQNMALLNYEQLPDTEYPYNINGQLKTVLKQDFDGRVNIIPVSDPNVFSSAQRIAQAQAVFQVATQMPDISDRREAAYNLLTAMRIPQDSINTIFPMPQGAERADPVSEIVLVVMGRPVKAALDQDHQAHIAVLAGALQQKSLPPQALAPMQALMAEHMAMQFFMQLQQQMGTQLPTPNWDAKKTDPMAPPIPPQFENMIAQKAAQAMGQIMQQIAQAQAQAQQAQQGPQQAPQQPDNSVEVAQIAAAAKQHGDDQQAAVKQADIQTKAAIANGKQVQAENEFMAQMALKNEQFRHQQQTDFAKIQQQATDTHQKTVDAVQQMLDEFRHEIGLKALKQQTPQGE